VYKLDAVQHKNVPKQIVTRLNAIAMAGEAGAIASIDRLASSVSKMTSPDINRHLSRLNRGLQSLRIEQ
jgi:hypothetical protein